MSSRVTPKKSQFIKCRLLGKKKRLFSLRNCLFSVGSSFFFWKALFSLAVFLVRTPVSFLQMSW